MTKPFYIICKFFSDICFKFRCQLIYGAGKHKVLPYYQAQLITNIKKPVVRIKASAPYADHVKIGKPAVFQKSSGLFFTSSSQKMLLRNIIGSHCKKGFSIYFMGKAFPILIFFALHGHSPKTDPLFPGVFHISFIQKLRLYLVQRLISKSVGPPELRIFNNQLALSLC